MVLSLLPPVLIQWEHYRWAHHMLDSRAIWWAGDRHLVPMLVRRFNICVCVYVYREWSKPRSQRWLLERAGVIINCPFAPQSATHLYPMHVLP